MRILVPILVVALLSGCAADSDQAAVPEISPAEVGAAVERDDTEIVRAPVVLGEVEITDTSPDTLAELRALPPERLTVGGLDIDMPVIDVGLAEDGQMEIPESAATAGWYRYGPAPGGERGSAVVAAHVDDAQIGLGPFSRLEGIAVGERVEVVMTGGEVLEYEVSQVERTSKREVDMSLVFDRSGESRLVLVTCGGRFDWDTGHYEDNVVVYATPIDHQGR